jgi:hypothetical protein
VSRALAGTVALALVATLSLTPRIGGLGGGSRAVAADCAWQRHAKRVVKHVRRDGRTRRVMRMKYWWSCNPLVTPPAIGPPPTILPGSIIQTGTEPEPSPRRVSVKADDAVAEDFSFSLSRPFVVSGEVTVELNNQGQDPHNLNVRPEGSVEPPLEVGEAGPGESRVAHLSLSPGTYQLWCSLPQHEEWGMSVDLEVRAG